MEALRQVEALRQRVHLLRVVHRQVETTQAQVLKVATVARSSALAVKLVVAQAKALAQLVVQQLVVQQLAVISQRVVRQRPVAALLVLVVRSALALLLAVPLPVVLGKALVQRMVRVPRMARVHQVAPAELQEDLLHLPSSLRKGRRYIIT